MIIAFFCIVISLLFELYLKHKFINYMILTTIASYIQCLLDYRFYYKMWNYEDVEVIFREYTLRIWIYTVISAVVIYFIFKLINKLLIPKTHFTLEEVITTKSQQN